MVSYQVSSDREEGSRGEEDLDKWVFMRPIGRIRMTTIHCRHHWIIETAAGPVSEGKCRICGEKRDLRNSVETGSGWNPRNKKEK